MTIVPLSATVCLLLVPATAMLAVLVPLEVGAKPTVRIHVPLGLTDEVQPLETGN